MNIIRSKAEDTEDRINYLHEERYALYMVDDFVKPLLHKDLVLNSVFYSKLESSLDLSFTFAYTSRLALSEREDIALKMYDLDFAPYGYVYTAVNTPKYYIDSFNSLTIRDIKLKLSFCIGKEIPEEFKLRKIVKISEVEEIEYEVGCKL